MQLCCIKSLFQSPPVKNVAQEILLSLMEFDKAILTMQLIFLE